MTISDETLMAFADEEVDDATRAAVEGAMREDPEISLRVERHRALRRRLQREFAGELSEPVPQQLLAVLREAPAAATNNVVNLREAQAARAAQSRAAELQGGGTWARSRAFWRAAPSIAAGVLLGLGIGYVAWRQGGLPIGRGAAGILIANGLLDAALSQQLTAEQGGAGAVHVGLSYLAKSGDYCRTFTFAGSAPAGAAPASGAPASGAPAWAAPASGVACRRAGQWQIQALAQGSAAHGETYRPAATALPAVILQMVQDQIQGEPLDAAGEAAARRQRWQSPK